MKTKEFLRTDILGSLNNNDIELVMETSQVSWRSLGIGPLLPSLSGQLSPSLSCVWKPPLAHLLLTPLRNLPQLQITGACNCLLLLLLLPI